MANAGSQNPVSNDFNAHYINEHATYRALFLLSPGDAANRLEIGNLQSHVPLLRYRVELNGGRLGTPGVEVKIAHVPSGKSASIFFEPGVASGAHYHLDSFSAEFLGKPGGGGHKYDQDPISIGALPLGVKKTTLKVRINIYGHVSPDPSAIGILHAALPNGSPARQFITRLTTPSDHGLEAWIYCIIPAQGMARFETGSLAYLRYAVANRLPPYFQYNYPQNNINLAMQPLPGFRHHMNCQVTSMVPRIQYGSPSLQLMDTRGRCQPRPMAQVNGVGLIREEQRQNALWRSISSGPQQLRFVMASWPALGVATRAFRGVPGRAPVREPISRAIYIGIMEAVNIQGAFSTDRPHDGAVVLIECCRQQADGKWLPTGELAFGIVLQIAQSDLDAARAKVVFGLWIQNNALKRRIAFGLANTVLETVHITVIANTKKPQARLQALKQFVTQFSTPAIMSLHVSVLFSTHPATQTRRDLRHGPSAPQNDPNELNSREARFNSAVQDFRSLAQMSNLSQNENRFLTQVPAQLDGFYRLVRASVQQESFRSVLILALSLTNTVAQNDSGRKSSNQIILVVDDIEDRAKICYDLHHLLHVANANGRNGGALWRLKKMMSWTMVEIDHHFTPPPRDHASIRQDPSDAVHPFREQLELTFKFLFSDLPQHSITLDQTAVYSNAPSNNPPLHHTPLSMSMGDCKQGYFITHPQEAGRYYRDRAKMLNNDVSSVDDVHELVQRCHAVDQKVLGEIDILVTDAATAMSEDVKAAFAAPIIIYVNAQAATFPEAAGVFMAYPRMEAAFVIGDSADQRHPAQFASGPEWNEAWQTYGRPLMTMMMQNAGMDCFVL